MCLVMFIYHRISQQDIQVGMSYEKYGPEC